MSRQPIHPIQVAAARTGLSPFVIRAWERRYGVVKPRRDQSGRRIYSDQELARLDLLRQATQAGHAIGLVAPLPRRQIEKLMAGSSRAKATNLSRRIEAGAVCREDCLAAVRNLNAGELEQALQRGLLQFGHQGFLQVIVAPLAEELGQQWWEGKVTAAHEHFFTAAAKVFLGQLHKQFAPGAEMPNLIACTPAGQLHELGAFMVGTVAIHLGWRVTYLGPGLPAAEIAGAARQNQAAAVALSIIYPADDPTLSKELLALRRYLPASTRIIAGGRAAPAYGKTLARMGAIIVNSLAECGEALDALRRKRNGAVKNPKP